MLQRRSENMVKVPPLTPIGNVITVADISRVPYPLKRAITIVVTHIHCDMSFTARHSDKFYNHISDWARETINHLSKQFIRHA